MTEPWNLRKDDDRKEDSLPTFIIFCEDEVSEPIYFKYFETSLIKINPIPNQKSKMPNVLKAISYCTKNGLMELNEGSYRMCCIDTQIWCVYDRDKEDTVDKIQEGDISFDESIETANAKCFRLAWSNDAFELWILLHFEDVDLTNINFKNRLTYYYRLTEIFKTLPNPNDDLIKALNYKNFNYKQSLKSENNFRNIVRSEIISKTKDAIERAKILEAHFSELNIPNHEKSPCTMVHHLVEELIRLGGKRIE